MDDMRFSRHAVRNPNAVAIIDGAERHWSRGELAALINSLSRSLRARGIAAGDSLAIVAPNCAEYIVAYLAATQIGLHVIPVNWHLAPPEIQYILENSGARVLVAHERMRSAMELIAPRLSRPPEVRISIGEVRRFERLEDCVRGYSAEPLADPVQGRILSYTSATTGRPKGVLLSLANARVALNNALKSRIAAGTLPEAHVLLCASLLYHGAPLENVTTALHLGHVAVLMDFLAPETILKRIERYRVTMAYMVPVMFTRLLNLDGEVRARYSTASLQRVLHTGAMCPVAIKERMIAWWGPIFVEIYGATEGIGTIVSSVDWLKYPGTVGRPISGTRLRIVSDEGEELPAGAIGNIYMTRFSGDRFDYLGDPEKTRAAHHGEFFTVGDVGYVNPEGYLFLCDRKVDMINLGGMKVYSAEIESVMAGHPYVADCAVFGIPDEVTGEAVVAWIQLAEGAPDARESKAAILQHLTDHLAVVKHPRYWEFVATLPRDDTGKLKKRHLREARRGRDGSKMKLSS
jgi:long-chain acyl-CoA synthetase